MPTLLLLRHAKAVPHGGDDFARGLTDKGRSDAKRLGTFLKQKRLMPERALVSSALRTSQTMEALQTTLDTAIPTTLDDALYNANRDQLRERVRYTAEGIGTLLILGHNPGILDLALALSTAGDPRDLDKMRSRFPPCGLAVIEFDHGDWHDASLSGGRLDWFVMPEDLGAV